LFFINSQSKPWFDSRAVVRHVSLRNTPNAILGSSSLPVVVSQSDKRLQTELFCVGVVWQTQSIMVRTRKRESKSALTDCFIIVRSSEGNFLFQQNSIWIRHFLVKQLFTVLDF